jgi:hypothetical protein
MHALTIIRFLFPKVDPDDTDMSDTEVIVHYAMRIGHIAM